MKRRDFNIALAAAVSGVAAGAMLKPSRAAAQDKPAPHVCKSMNECKGQGGCKTAKNDCAGLNECKPR